MASVTPNGPVVLHEPNRDDAVGAEWLHRYRPGQPRRNMADNLGYPYDPDTGHPRDTSTLRGGATWWHWCTHRGIPLLQATHRNVLRWIDESETAINARTGEPYEGTTRGQMLSAVRSFYGYAKRYGYYTGDNPADVIDTAKYGLSTSTKTSTTRSLTQGELSALQHAADHDTTRGADSLRSGLVVATLAQMALRVDEFCTLTTDAVVYDREERRLSILGKGRRRRILTIPPPLLARLDAYQHAHAGRELARNTGAAPPLVPTSTGRAYSRAGVAQLLRKLARHAEIGDPSTVTPHVLRHTWASMAREAQVSERAIQETLGHANPETTARYGSAVAGESKQAVEQTANYIAT